MIRPTRRVARAGSLLALWAGLCAGCEPEAVGPPTEVSDLEVEFGRWSGRLPLFYPMSEGEPSDLYGNHEVGVRVYVAFRVAGSWAIWSPRFGVPRYNVRVRATHLREEVPPLSAALRWEPRYLVDHDGDGLLGFATFTLPPEALEGVATPDSCSYHGDELLVEVHAYDLERALLPLGSASTRYLLGPIGNAECE